MHSFERVRSFAQARHHRFAEFLGADLLLAGAFLKNVVGVDAVFHGAEPGIVNALGDIRLIEMHQHQHAAQQEPGGVGQVLAGAARRGSVDGLEQGAWRADVGRSRETNRSRDLRGHVGKNVAVEIGHQDDVKGFRRVGHLGSTDVDNPMFFLDGRVIGADLVEDLVEHAVRHLHDVVFSEAGDLLAVVLQRVFEGVTGDALGARPGDDLQALHDGVAELVLHAGVTILFVLAHDDDVHVGVLGFDEGVIGDAGADVGIESEHLARGDIEALEAATLRGGDGGFVEDLGAAQRFPGAGLDAGGVSLEVDFLPNFHDFRFDARAGRLDDVERGSHDLGADSVAVRDRDAGYIGHSFETLKYHATRWE